MKNDLEELSVAARRGELPRAKEEELERLFDEAPDERIWHQAGLRFDAQDVPAPDDADIERRLLDRLLAEQPAALPRPRNRRPVVLLAAAAVFVASAAAAVAAIQHLRQARSTPGDSPPSGSVSSSAAVPPPPRAPARDPQAEPTPQAAAEVPAVQRPLSKGEELPETAAELLSSAGQARRKGESARAITLLEALQARFPGSAEARASDITLGMLRLERGATSAALKDFDRYLARSPSGDRAADALWGRSRALLALGRRDEAEKSLQELLARHPQSPNASAARAELRRLAP